MQKGRASRFELPFRSKIAISTAMESKFRCTGAHIFVLQDHYRLPARFFACVSGALNSRLR
ncbi:hypothetical protein TAL182_CH04328 [Rhizobium sp. TAL182]|nr:hypothetical protein TAL182_CH04328 [Rhizobium sp. TAL182]